LLLGARHIGYGLALHPLLPRSRRTRLLAAQLLIDESTALATTQPDKRNAAGAFWWAGLSVFVAWNVGTAVGAIFGDALGDPADLGLDAVFPAAFLALLVPLLRAADGRAAAICGGAIALALVPFVPAGVPIIVAAVGAVLGLRFAQPGDTGTKPSAP
jgi:predicted branched-subunit amino acid permease